MRKKVANFTKFIAEGHWSDTVAIQLAEAEKTLKALEIERSYLATKNGDRLFITPAAVRARMLDLGVLLGMAMPDANAKIRAIFPDKISMTPVLHDGRKCYRASGALNLFAFSESSVDKSRIAGDLPFVQFEVMIKPKSNS